MAELKTQKNTASVTAFLKKTVTDPDRRADCDALIELMEAATKAPATMWGASIVGFGTYTYTYATGRTGDWPLIGFSPRKTNLTLYIMSGFEGEPELMAKLGKFKIGKSCLYIKALSDLHLPTLKKLMAKSIAATKKRYPST
jgi:hypothetical protein